MGLESGASRHTGSQLSNQSAENGRAMAQREPVVDLLFEEIGLDAEGRACITNPKAAAQLPLVLAARRRKPKPPPKPNTNCADLCNTAAGCGPTNKKCNPNTVPNCGCRNVE